MSRTFYESGGFVNTRKNKFKIYELIDSTGVDLDIIKFVTFSPLGNTTIFWHGEDSYPTFEAALAAADLTMSKENIDGRETS